MSIRLCCRNEDEVWQRGCKSCLIKHKHLVVHDIVRWRKSVLEHCFFTDPASDSFQCRWKSVFPKLSPQQQRVFFSIKLDDILTLRSSKVPVFVDNFCYEFVAEASCVIGLDISLLYWTILFENKPLFKMILSQLKNTKSSIVTCLEVLREECKICMTVTKDMTTLPCGHTFCISCMEQTDKKCALCRTTHQVPLCSNVRLGEIHDMVDVYRSETNYRKRIMEMLFRLLYHDVDAHVSADFIMCAITETRRLALDC